MRRMIMLVATLAMTAAACGGSAGAGEGVATLDDTAQLESAGDTTIPEMTQEEALLAFTACMREAGIDLPDPTVDADGNLRLARPNSGAGAEGGDPSTFRNEDFRTAREECGSLLEGVALGFQDVDRTEIEDQMLEFAACMRDNGVPMDDPDFSNFGAPGAGGGPGGGRGFGLFGDLDPNDPTFQAAQAACGDILAGFGPGGGPGGGRFGGSGTNGQGNGQDN